MARFKENANMFNIVDETKAPIMHGHTCIELKDVKTGKRERIESDNTFMATTLAKQMRSLGYFNNNPHSNDAWSNQNMVRNFCGGVLLFKDAIPNGAEYMQAGNKMTANGCYGVVNNGTPIEFGSWNSVESNIDGNSSAVLVWDWTTSQGNGQISSVCLTSETGGYIGYGNPSGVAHSTTRAFYLNQNSRSYGCKHFHNNIAYNFEYNSADKVLSVIETRLPLTQASIFDKKTKRTRLLDLSSYTHITTSNYMAVVTISDNKAIIFPLISIANNNAFYFLILNLDTYSLTEKEVYNTTGVIWDRQRYMYDETNDILFVSKNISSGEVFYKINAETGALLDTVDNFGLMPTIFQDGMLQTGGFYQIFDLVNGTNYITNASNDFAYIYTYYHHHYSKEYDAVIREGNNANDTNLTGDITIYKNPLYLATINNLQESVTKQNTQTMKVTYTLTEV